MNRAKADTQQQFLIHLFWDSECNSALSHQWLHERDRTQSVMESYCHFQRATWNPRLHISGSTQGCYCESFELLLTPEFLMTPVSLRSPLLSVCPVSSCKGSNASILQVWEYCAKCSSWFILQAQSIYVYHSKYSLRWFIANNSKGTMIASRTSDREMLSATGEVMHDSSYWKQ